MVNVVRTSKPTEFSKQLKVRESKVAGALHSAGSAGFLELTGKRASTAVRRARLEKPNGRVHNQEDSRKVVSSFATAGAGCASSGCQGQAFRSFGHGGSMKRSYSGLFRALPSCLAKRLLGKSVTMVLMVAGSELDQSLRLPFPLTHALCIVGLRNTCPHSMRILPARAD